MEYNFKINLLGIIKLLSGHLYSNPDVFLRELLQNAADAIHARKLYESGFEGAIELHLVEEKNKLFLTIQDNGIGLSEADVHAFLSVIGQSSKSDLANARQEFIGQFGIGLLSCFMVSDEIQVISKSAKDHPAVCWRGHPDGKYTIEAHTHAIPAGTEVILQCKPEMERYFTHAFVARTTRKYGGMLLYPIYLDSKEAQRQHLNDSTPPWHQPQPTNLKQAYIDFGIQQLKDPPLDVVVLSSKAGGIQGAAYIMPYAYKHSAKTTHQVYLKNMLLSEQAEDILPDWAFFVKCIINTNQLTPTASRESFYEDELMEQTRTELGDCIRAYLKDLARNDPQQLQSILRIHVLAIKALALEDNDFYRLIIDEIPFETSMGRVTLGEYKKQNNQIKMVSRLDQYRQIAQVALAHKMWIINGGYIYDTDLLLRHEVLFPSIPVDLVDVASLSHEFQDIELSEHSSVTEFLHTCDKALELFNCHPTIKRFLPTEIPALYLTDENGNFIRSVEQSKTVSNSLWGGVLDNMTLQLETHSAQLCFNYNNPTVQRILRIRNENFMQSCVKMLYVQALLLGNHPLNTNELTILNTGLIDLIDQILSAEGNLWLNANPKSIN